MDDSSEYIIEESPNKRYGKLNVLLGKGAYKVVFKGLDREEGCEVAWNTSQTSKAEYIEISEEIEILKSVRHPNIIQFHDSWYSNSEFVFITEFMTSGTLREYIKKLKIPNLKIVKRWTRQILKGISYLHSHDPPIIHRDIKVKIGDMGTAKMKLGKKYTLIGTPEFMAPEMYEEKGYSEKVDIYAFGMALIEMAAGEYPYSECKNAAQVFRKVSQGIKPECLSRIQNPELLQLITRCIGLESQRQSAKEIVESSFLSEDPEVLLVSRDGFDQSHLVLQVTFNGTDKLSVRFDFQNDTDTAEEVVNEMINEKVLPHTYKTFITNFRPQDPASSERVIGLQSVGFDSATKIEDFVRQVVTSANRPSEKGDEWLHKLLSQDLLTVADLEQGLTVFATRLLRNALRGLKLIQS
ncbi:kinase-like domain-containing protein [Chytridium lagenaria]|nr:kinase-like domain-containing protein [Chytridium lagenaria]